MSTESPVQNRRQAPHAPVPGATEVAGVPQVGSQEDSLARAARRTQELRDHGSLDQGEDKFYIDPAIIPDGWSYEWRAYTVLGKEDPSYQVRLANSGWDPVPRDRHPFLMPSDYSGQTILRDGQMLMERPLVITQEAQQRDKKAARDQVRAKEEQLGAAPPGTFERGAHPKTAPSVKKTFESMPIPNT